MKLSKILVLVLIAMSLLIPCFVPAAQAATPSYVGVNEGQELIYKTEFDDGPLEEWLEHRYGETALATENWLGSGLSRLEYYMENVYWDPYNFDDDIVAWRVTIKEVGKEKDMDFDGDTFNERDVDYVKIKFSVYGTEDQADPDGWDDIDKSESYYLYDDEEEVYADFLIEGIYDQGMGFYYYSPNGNSQADWDAAPPEPMEPEWPMFFVPKGLDYDDVADEVEEKLEDATPALDDYYDAGTESVKYFFQNKDVGFDTTLEYIPGWYSYEKRPEDFDSTVKYNDDGIMYFYEWSYDGETIAKFVLDTPGGEYVIENWWWMALIAAGVLVGLIVICIVIKSRK